MKAIVKIIYCCLILLCLTIIAEAQDTSGLQYIEEMPETHAAESGGVKLEEVQATNDSVTEALDLDNEEGYDQEASRKEELQKMADEQAQNEPLYAEKQIDNKKWQQLKKDEKFNYDVVKTKKEKPEEKKDKSIKFDPLKWKNAMTILLFAMIALAVVLIIYAFFGKQYFAKPTQQLVQQEDNWEDVEVFSAWDKAIADAIANQDYRLATRILYLQTLQLLNDTNWIQYSKEKLSNQYLQKLYGTQLYKPFAQCNKYFDYVWYGKYPISQTAFTDIRAQFVQLQNQISTS
jgi:hypothetical protein